MSDKEAGGQKQLSVVAIAQADSRLQAVEVRKNVLRFEILWTQSGKDNQTDWPGFAADCGLARGSVGQDEGDGCKKVVAGFSSAGVVFNQIDVPAAARADAESIVRLQAESRLPLSADQMELAWRAGHASNGQMPVTMAAAKTEHIESFVEGVRDLAPTKIMLDSEGIVRAWRTLFGGDNTISVVVSVGGRNSQVCLAQDGALINAVVLDMGKEDFSTLRTGTEAAERFVRDVTSVLTMFDHGEPVELPIAVLSNGDDAIDAMVTALESGGLNARSALPDVSEIAKGTKVDADIIYDYRLPIGLGMVALDGRGDELNIFKRLYTPAKKEEKKPWLASLTRSILIAAAMLVVFVLVSFMVDRAKPGAIDEAIETAMAAESDTDMTELKNRQSLRNAIALQRADMLQLMNVVNGIGQGGIKLQEVDFRMGQMASISGESPGPDQVYKFEKDLNAHKYISDARILSQSRDSKSKKYKFSVEFKYKKFSDKKTRR